MKALLILCVAFCSLALSGCEVVYSAHPLNNSEDEAVDDPQLVGHWTPSDQSDGSFCILKADRNTYTMIAVETESKTGIDKKPTTDSIPGKPLTLVGTYRISLVRLQDQLFADMVADKMAVNGMEIEPPLGTIYGHVILKLDLNDFDLGLSILDTKAVGNATEQGYAPLSYVEISDGLLLTASTEDLRWSVSRYADRLFVDGGHYARADDNEANNPSPSPCTAIPPS
jgi:hypothetical protein